MTTTTPPHILHRHDLDAVRVGAFALLIFYHVGMFYVPWDFHVNSARPQEWLEPLMRFTSPWRLTLLFLVSGAATRLLFEKYRRQGSGAAERLGGSRLFRLLLPLIFGMLVIVPPQTYYEVVQHVRDNGLADDIYHNALTTDFWIRYVTSQGEWCDAKGCITTPTWNHLWFVAYAMIYGLIAALVAGWSGSNLSKATQRFEKLFGGIGLLIWPIAYLAVIRIWLFPDFPVTHDLFGDLYNHTLSLAAFGFGFMMAQAPRITDALKRYRHIFGVLALVSYVIWIAYLTGFKGTVPPDALKQAMRVIYAIDQWAFICAILGYAARHIHSDSPVMRWLSGGVFTFYIVHQTLIVVVAFYLESLKLPLGLEMGLVCLVTITGCALAYEIARRTGPFGVLLGVTPPRKLRQDRPSQPR